MLISVAVSWVIYCSCCYYNSTSEGFQLTGNVIKVESRHGSTNCVVAIMTVFTLTFTHTAVCEGTSLLRLLRATLRVRDELPFRLLSVAQ